MRTIFIDNLKKNQTLTNYISMVFPNLAYSMLKKALRNKDIKVNLKRVTCDVILANNDRLDIYITDDILFNLPTLLDYIYEDDNILAIYKPQGLLSNNEEKLSNLQIKKIGGLEPTLEDLVCSIYSLAKICHRLDRNTAGIVLFSKHDSAYTELLRGFKNANIEKKYLAYVFNASFTKKSEVLNNYILKDPKAGFSKIFNTKVPQSQSICTKYNVIFTNFVKNYAILEVNIYTGKTHQIRAQLEAISHPIIGDPKYCTNEINRKFKIYKQLLFAIKYTFNFECNSILYYLNNIEIKLDNKYYEKKIGCDLNE
ncbi:MAG: RluA family pseudouridine synthase [Clostridia bacterium]